MDTAQLQGQLLEWYEQNKRDLPWRRTTDPYEILVAEIMLQQTQVSRVIPKWNTFLEEFPSVDTLAAAPLSEVLELWDGLGYNRRAKYLKQAAETVVTDFDGDFPDDPETLQELPGVGPYTANAIASFAFNNGGPVFDTNVRRVMYRFHGSAPDDELEAVHARIFPSGESRLWNNAIMELGATVCTDGTPRCRDCPWRSECDAFRRKDFSTPDIQQQSSFEGSWRQYRAKALKILMDGDKTRDELGRRLELPDEYELDELLEELAAEDMITIDSEMVRLPH